MANILVQVESLGGRRTRPNLAQIKTVMEFMKKHPDLAQRKLRYGCSHQKFQKLWIELANKLNEMDGGMKTTRGWIKFWSDKRRCILIKQKEIREGKPLRLSSMEQKILELCDDKLVIKKKRFLKNVPRKKDRGQEFVEDILRKSNDDVNNAFSTRKEREQLDLMERLVDAMGQQADALSQVALAHLDNSKSLERLAEASHIQALAVDRVSSSIENIGSSVLDVRNALLSIDYTMKSYSTGQQRQSSNLFS